jgi:hypothetical protein
MTSPNRGLTFRESVNSALKERLKYSQLQLSSKESECQALLKLVEELRFQIPSTRFVYSLAQALGISSNFIYYPCSFSGSFNQTSTSKPTQRDPTSDI